MKGIILAGGSGTRLYPSTLVASKQLLPVYDKPMIYYPLTTLIHVGIRDILIISTNQDIPNFKKLLGDGSQLGISLEYCVQDKPNGIAEAFILGEKFIDEKDVALILGDNIFFGNNFSLSLQSSLDFDGGAQLFAHHVADPQRFGVIEFDKEHNVLSIEEKPVNPKSNYAVTGLYFYDSKVCDYAKSLKPSERNELEITDLNKIYLEKKQLKVNLLGRGHAWLDSGTHDSLLETSNFVQTIQRSQDVLVGSPEEAAFQNGWIDEGDIENIILKNSKNQYGQMLKKILS